MKKKKKNKKNSLKCVENVFIKPIANVASTEIQLTLLPKSTISKEDIYIPNWIFKYWEDENKIIMNNFEVVIEIIEGKNLIVHNIVNLLFFFFFSFLISAFFHIII